MKTCVKSENSSFTSETIFLHLLTIVLTPICEFIFILIICLINAVFFHFTDENHFVSPIVEVKKRSFDELIFDFDRFLKIPVRSETEFDRPPLDHSFVLHRDLTLTEEQLRQRIRHRFLESSLIRSVRDVIGYVLFLLIVIFVVKQTLVKLFHFFDLKNENDRIFSLKSERKMSKLDYRYANPSFKFCCATTFFNKSIIYPTRWFICLFISSSSSSSSSSHRFGFEMLLKNVFFSVTKIIHVKNQRVLTFESVSFTSSSLLARGFLSADSPFYLSKSLRIRQIRLEQKNCSSCFTGGKNLLKSSSNVISDRRICVDVCNYTSIYSPLAYRQRSKLYVTYESPWFYQMFLSPEETVRFVSSFRFLNASI